MLGLARLSLNVSAGWALASESDDEEGVRTELRERVVEEGEELVCWRLVDLRAGGMLEVSEWSDGEL